MWFLRILILASFLTAYGEYLVLGNWENDLAVPAYVRDFMSVLPDHCDAMKIVQAQKAYARLGFLTLIFRPPLEADEVTTEINLLVYLPHRGNVPTTNYTINIWDLFTGRDIGHKFLGVRKSGWYKVSFDRWSERGLGFISTNRGLSMHLLRDGKNFDFEEFYNGNERLTSEFLPVLLTCNKYKKPQKWEKLEIGNDVEFDVEASRSANVPARSRRMQRSSGSTSCSYTIQHMYLNLTAINGTLLSPGNYTTKICHGSCPPSLSTSSSCDQSVEDCCVPSAWQTFAVLYIDQNASAFVLKTIPDLVVTDCACASSITNSG